MASLPPFVLSFLRDLTTPIAAGQTSAGQHVDERHQATGFRPQHMTCGLKPSLKEWPGGISTVSLAAAILRPTDKSRALPLRRGAGQRASTERYPGCRTEGIGKVTVPSDPRRDMERFLAMGGGSLDLLLAMLDGAQAPETPPTEAASQTPGSPTWVPEGYRLERSPDVLSLRRADGSFVAVFSAQ